MAATGQIVVVWHRLRRWLTLDGQLVLARPGAIIAAVAGAGLALVFPTRWLLYSVYAYLLLLLMSYLWLRAIGPRLRLNRRLMSAWAEVGDELEEHWSLVNSSLLPLHWLEIDDASTLPGYNARRVVSCEAGGAAAWQTKAGCERRGLYRLGPLTAQLGDPLGIFRFVWRDATVRQLVVYPPLVRLPPLPLPHGQRGGLAKADLLQLHATPSVGGVRDYTPGDPPSRIHWPYVARLQRLVVKEFDQERAGAIWLLLDLAAASYQSDAQTPQRDLPAAHYGQSSVMSARAATVQPATLLDLAITLTASLAAQVLAEGRVVGLICDDGRRRVVQPGSGSRQLWQILNELVDGAATGQQSLGDLLRGGWGARGGQLAGAALVLITGALEADWLPAVVSNGRRPGGAVALLVAANAAQAAPCETLLATRGVAARTFTLGTALPLVHPPRQRVTTRVSPLGRVIHTTTGEA